MTTISLEGSLRTCKVDSGYAAKLQSDRIFNPQNMLCPVWNGVDTAGRQVCADSYYTKTAGCSSAADRVLVENQLRPKYIDYVYLDARGIGGEFDCDTNSQNAYDSVKCADNTVRDTHNYTGQFGYNTGFSQNINASCSQCGIPSDQAVKAIQMRRQQGYNMGKEKFCNSCSSGML